VVGYDSYGLGAAGTSSSVTPTGAASTFASTVLSDNPVAYFRLSETTGSLAADSSGNGGLANYNLGSTTLGDPGAGLTSDPSTSINNANGWGWNADQSYLPTTPLPSGNAPRSMGVWLKMVSGDTGCQRWVMGYGAQSSGAGFGFGSARPTSTSRVGETTSGWARVLRR
jgi:hypothetical protein